MMNIFVLRGHWWNPVDWIVMHRSGSPYNHCGVVVDDKNAMVIDSTVGGVKLRSLREDWKGYKAEIYEFVASPISEYLDAKMLLWIGSLIGREYDYLSWLGFATGWKFLQKPDQWFCSELVYQMFWQNGIHLTDQEMTFVFPSFFATSPMFKIKEVIQPKR